MHTQWQCTPTMILGIVGHSDVHSKHATKFSKKAFRAPKFRRLRRAIRGFAFGTVSSSPESATLAVTIIPVSPERESPPRDSCKRLTTIKRGLRNAVADRRLVDPNLVRESSGHTVVLRALVIAKTEKVKKVGGHSHQASTRTPASTPSQIGSRNSELGTKASSRFIRATSAPISRLAYGYQKRQLARSAP